MSAGLRNVSEVSGEWEYDHSGFSQAVAYTMRKCSNRYHRSVQYARSMEALYAACGLLDTLEAEIISDISRCVKEFTGSDVNGDSLKGAVQELICTGNFLDAESLTESIVNDYDWFQTIRETPAPCT